MKTTAMTVGEVLRDCLTGLGESTLRTAVRLQCVWIGNCQSGTWSGSSVKTVTRVNSGYETISVSCNSDEHLTGGGAQCNPSGKERLKWSNPNGNGWAAACPREELTVFAICSSK